MFVSCNFQTIICYFIQKVFIIFGGKKFHTTLNRMPTIIVLNQEKSHISKLIQPSISALWWLDALVNFAYHEFRAYHCKAQ